MTLNWETFDKELFVCINETAKGRVKACARNATHHLERAWEIKDIDPEMSIFRAITAEEESATAIFFALKKKKYENAEKIKFKKHSYKQALSPFITALSKFIADASQLFSQHFGEKYRLSFEGDGKKKRLSLSFYFRKGTITAIPPLGFSIKINGKPYHFDKELLEVISGQSKKDITNHVVNIANLRNRLLYATPEGIPTVTGKIEGELEKRRKTVIIFLRILSLIFPYKEKALFVQQALNAYLTMMKDIEKKVK